MRQAISRSSPFAGLAQGDIQAVHKVEIEIHIAGWSAEDAQRAAGIIESKIRQALPNVDSNECRLTRLVVADDINYGAVIDRLAPGETFTRGHGMLGVGKTLGYRDSQGMVSNRVVIHADMMNAVLENHASGSRPELSVLECQRALYVLPHELGHCRDNVARPSNVDEQGATIETHFKIRRLNEVSVRMAICEYAACFHSAASVSPALLLDEFHQYGEWCRRVWTDVHGRRQRYSGQHELFDLAVAASKAAWLTITQACKILGFRRGNSKLGIEPVDWAQWLGPKPGEGFRAAEPILAKSWEGYPDQLDAFRSHLIRCWWELTRAQGFDFREGTEGDGVFFDR